jgi:phospholipase/lecithinase/hemolysin
LPFFGLFSGDQHVSRASGSWIISALVFAALVVAAAPGNAGSFNELVVIGDSLSDTGNIYARSGDTYPPSPPYDAGRYSNGPVWVEVLADALGLPAPNAVFGPAPRDKTNWAQGGATTGYKTTELGETGETGEIGMAWQVDEIATDPTITSRIEDALVVVWGGANDFLDAPTTADPSTSASNLADRVEKLIGLGARSFLLANLPPLDRTPEFTTINPALASLAEAFSTGFDTAYRAEVAALEAAYPDVEFYYFDVYAIFEDVLANPGAYGFTNVTGSALEGTTVVPDPDDYLFWDSVHPTRTGHAELGMLAAELVREPSEQPAVALLMMGLGGLVAQQRRGAMGGRPASA